MRAVDPEDPLLRNVTLDGVNVLDSVAMSLPEWANTAVAGDLADGSSVPLLMYGEQGGRRMAVLAFDLSHSDFPPECGLPDHPGQHDQLAGPARRQASVPAALLPGEPLVFDLPAGVVAGRLHPAGWEALHRPGRGWPGDFHRHHPIGQSTRCSGRMGCPSSSR